ncbi:MAG TPA: hypothetical protein VID29_05145, partial [Solirubrobacteraceae bacterium]
MSADDDSPRPTPRRPRHPPAPAAPARPAPAPPAPARPAPGSARAKIPRAPDADSAPPYTRYRARRLPLPGRAEHGVLLSEQPPGRGGRRAATATAPRLRRFPRLSRRRALLAVLALLGGWLLLSLALFLLSAQFNRTSPPADVAAVLAPAGFPLTSANNILVL